MQRISLKSVQQLSHKSLSKFYMYLNVEIVVGSELKLTLAKPAFRSFAVYAKVRLPDKTDKTSGISA